MKINLQRGIPVIALSGGPCSGKTTMLAVIQQYLNNLGYKVFLSPEAATLLINSGVTPWEFPNFQSYVLQQVTQIENQLIAAAKKHPAKKKVVITDRGKREGEAYVGKKEFLKFVKKEGFTLTQLRDDSYDAVFFLRTAALGAEQFYTTANNSARKESIDEAREVDQRTLDTWIGHPHLRVIENGPGGFEEKKRKTLAAICGFLGIPEPLEIERKFLISPPDFSKFPVPVAEIEIEQFYLKNEGRIRKRGQSGGFTYYYTMKRDVKPGVRVELERRITQEEFLKLAQQVDHKKYRPISKKRYCFVWSGQYFELDIISKPKKIYLLELELGAEDDEIIYPPFVHIIRDVTHEKEFSNKEIARIKRPR